MLKQQTSHKKEESRSQQYCLSGAILVILAVALYVGYGQSSVGAQKAAPGQLDPLSTTEEQMGLAQLNELLPDSQNQTAASSASDSSAPERQVVLGMERHHQAKGDSGDRRGEGYIYDYSTNTLQKVLVDLESGETELIESVQDVQLPLILEEEEKALVLVRQDPETWQLLRDAFFAQTNAELTALSQLETKILIFQADAMPEHVNTESSRCGRHRCAQVLLFTRDKFAFEISPIVDLSTETVAQLMVRE